MRNKQLEVTNPASINDILQSCEVCRLGLNDNGKVYIVPVNYGFTEKNGTYTLYFHGAKVGRKAELIRETGYAAFEMDTKHKVREGEKACDYTALFQSIIGSGKVSSLEDSEEKKEAFGIIFSHYTDRTGMEYDAAKLNAAGVFKLEVEELSCKEHLR